jgi:hypothetical protein
VAAIAVGATDYAGNATVRTLSPVGVRHDTRRPTSRLREIPSQSSGVIFRRPVEQSPAWLIVADESGNISLRRLGRSATNPPKRLLRGLLPARKVSFASLLSWLR